jgi:hypothetical protein
VYADLPADLSVRRSRKWYFAVPAGAGFADASVRRFARFLKEKRRAVRALPGVGYGESAALLRGLDGAVVFTRRG